MSSSAFLKGLELVKEGVEERLRSFFGEKIAEAARISAGAEGLIRVLEGFTLRGGKRVRAALVYHGHLCFSSRQTESVWKLAMCLELVQSFLLIHDDVIDEDDTRRGDRTVHRYYSDLHREKYRLRDPEHFGESMAILCGDLSLSLAHEIVHGLALEPALRTELLARMNRMITHAIYGECMDVVAGVEAEAAEEDILAIGMLKTATYTIEGPLHMGALLGGAREPDLERLSGYAIPLGKAFQIQDDILGLFGDAAKLGKPVGSDIREGKKTFLIHEALKSATRAQRSFLQGVLGDREATEERLDEVRAIVVETGALEACRQKARRLVEASRRALRECRLRQEGAAFLEGAIVFMVEREH